CPPSLHRSSDTIVPKSRQHSISPVGLCILRTVACRSDSPSKLDRPATLAAEDPHGRTPVKITHGTTDFDGFARKRRASSQVCTARGWLCLSNDPRRPAQEHVIRAGDLISKQ